MAALRSYSQREPASAGRLTICIAVLPYGVRMHPNFVLRDGKTQILKRKWAGAFSHSMGVLDYVLVVSRLECTDFFRSASKSSSGAVTDSHRLQRTSP